MTLVKKKIRAYWSVNPVLTSSFAGKLLSHDQFLGILALLHIKGISLWVPHNQTGQCTFHKIHPLFDFIINRYKQVFMQAKI